MYSTHYICFDAKQPILCDSATDPLSIDLAVPLASTDYAKMLSSSSAVDGGLLRRLCLEKLEQQFQELRAGALQPMGKFLDYLTYGYMIDNVCLLISGQLNGRDPEEQFASLNPLGKFPAISAVSVADGPQSLYDYVLCQTPLGPYFKKVFPYVDMQINHAPPPFGETNIEIIRESLYKAYYEDFYRFCQHLGGITAEVMCELLEFEADRRAITITVNAVTLNSEMTKDDRFALYPRIGKLWPEASAKLALADNQEQIIEAVQFCQEYRRVFDEVSNSHAGADSLDEAFKKPMIKKNLLAFEQQFHYGVFWAWLKLKEHEADNIQYIADAISYNKREHINDFIGIQEMWDY